MICALYRLTADMCHVPSDWRYVPCTVCLAICALYRLTVGVCPEPSVIPRPLSRQSEYESLVPPPPEPVASPEPAPAGHPTPARHGTPRPAGRSASGEARHPSQTGDERRQRTLPEAAFCEDDDYQLDDAPPMPTNYIRSADGSRLMGQPG